MHKGTASLYADENHHKKVLIVFEYTNMLLDSDSHKDKIILPLASKTLNNNKVWQKSKSIKLVKLVVNDISPMNLGFFFPPLSSFLESFPPLPLHPFLEI